MHYYKRNLGDIAKKTAHLSPLEFGIYNLILDAYYDREIAPTLMEATRWARARTEEEKGAVLAILDEFFTMNGDRYFQKRVEEELEQYQGKAETNRVIAVEREKRKRERRQHEPCTNRAPEINESCTSGQPNHKPLTTNQEPIQVNTNVPSADRTPVGHAEVFDYWKTVMNHPKAKLDGKRERAIKGRLKDGYTVEQLCRAVDGCKATPYNMGQNRDGTVYDDIELICRNAPNTDRFIRAGSAFQSGMSPGLQQQVDILQRWVEEGGE